jgi:hypothetical protein
LENNNQLKTSLLTLTLYDFSISQKDNPKNKGKAK